MEKNPLCPPIKKGGNYEKTRFLLSSVHPETTNFWMELSAVSNQRSANTLFLMSFADSRKLRADSASPKTLVSG